MSWINLQLFGGRGSSSGGGSGGSASRAAAAPAPAPTHDADGIPLQMTPQNMLSFFDTATPAQADALITKLRATPQGEGEQATDAQRFMNAVGWTDREPEVLDESQWQAAWNAAGNPQRYYHSDKPAGGKRAKEFAKQYMGGATDFAGNKLKQYVSGGVYGDGTYFATTALGSKFYGTNQFRGFLNGNAKVVDYTQIFTEMTQYENSHPGFKQFLNRATSGYNTRRGGSRDGLVSIYAAMKGYNVISNGFDYISVLDRSVTTVSRQQKSTRGMRANW